MGHPPEVGVEIRNAKIERHRRDDWQLDRCGLGSNAAEFRMTFHERTFLVVLGRNWLRPSPYDDGPSASGSVPDPTCPVTALIRALESFATKIVQHFGGPPTCRGTVQSNWFPSRRPDFCISFWIT